MKLRKGIAIHAILIIVGISLGLISIIGFVAETQLIGKVVEVDEPEQTITVITIPETTTTSTITTTTTIPEVKLPENFEPEKTDKPVAQLYVMSFCPYGIQAETTMKPVVDLLGSKVSIEPHFIVSVKDDTVTSLHGYNEAKEDMRQACIWKNYGQATFWVYVNWFDNNCKSCNIDICWKEAANKANVDVAEIEGCVNTDGLTLMKAEEALSKQNGVSGSPTLIINGATYNGGRTAEAYKQAICSAFNKQPIECTTILNTTVPSTSSASCGDYTTTIMTTTATTSTTILPTTTASSTISTTISTTTSTTRTTTSTTTSSTITTTTTTITTTSSTTTTVESTELIQKPLSEIIMSGDDLSTEWVYGSIKDKTEEFISSGKGYYDVPIDTDSVQEILFRDADKIEGYSKIYIIENTIFKFSSIEPADDYYEGYIGKVKEERGYTDISTNYGDKSFGFKTEETPDFKYIEIVFRERNLVVHVLYELSGYGYLYESVVKDLAGKIENKI